MKISPNPKPKPHLIQSDFFKSRAIQLLIRYWHKNVIKQLCLSTVMYGHTMHALTWLTIEDNHMCVRNGRHGCSKSTLFMLLLTASKPNKPEIENSPEKLLVPILLVLPDEFDIAERHRTKYEQKGSSYSQILGSRSCM